MSAVLQQWVTQQTGIEAVWMHQNAPRVAKPHATLEIIASPLIGDGAVSQPDSEGIVTITQNNEPTVSIKIYTDGDPRQPLELMTALRRSLFKDSVRELLSGSGWHFVDVLLGPDNIPQLVGTRWEPRAVMDLRFRLADIFEDDLGVIDSVRIAGNVSGTEINIDTGE